MQLLKYVIPLLGFFFCCKSSTNQDTSQLTTSDGKPPISSFSTYNVSWSEIQQLGKTPYDYLIPYGEEELQFGELRVPETSNTPFPLVVFIHGGCWQAAYNLNHVSAVCADLVKEGYAVWTPEYRRIGDERGGYPNTFLDLQKSIKYISKLAEIYPVDVKKVFLLGHSAGGHLALWLSNQQGLSKESPFYNNIPFVPQGVISLAGITDLIAYDTLGNDCSEAVQQLMGGTPLVMQEQYQQINPSTTLPDTIPIRLVHGDQDNIVPISQSEGYAKKAVLAGKDVKVITVEGGGHFDMVSPHSAAWQLIKAELNTLAKR